MPIWHALAGMKQWRNTARFWVTSKRYMQFWLGWESVFLQLRWWDEYSYCSSQVHSPLRSCGLFLCSNQGMPTQALKRVWSLEDALGIKREWPWFHQVTPETCSSSSLMFLHVFGEAWSPLFTNTNSSLETRHSLQGILKHRHPLQEGPGSFCLSY